MQEVALKVLKITKTILKVVTILPMIVETIYNASVDYEKQKIALKEKKKQKKEDLRQ